MGASKICSMISVLHGPRLCTLASTEMDLRVLLKEKFGLFVDFEFLTEMGSWDTD